MSSSSAIVVPLAHLPASPSTSSIVSLASTLENVDLLDAANGPTVDTDVLGFEEDFKPSGRDSNSSSAAPSFPVPPNEPPSTVGCYRVLPRVYFGPAKTTDSASTMALFTHVANVDATFSSTSTRVRMALRCKHFPCEDVPDYRILDTHLLSFCEFVNGALADPNAHVFIHCAAGVNRSAALTAAYVCSMTTRPAEDVLAEMRRDLGTGRGSTILTNAGFEKQLLERFPALRTAAAGGGAGKAGGRDEEPRCCHDCCLS
jgi:protein-tyrosine phosphatase